MHILGVDIAGKRRLTGSLSAVYKFMVSFCLLAGPLLFPHEESLRFDHWSINLPDLPKCPAIYLWIYFYRQWPDRFGSAHYFLWISQSQFFSPAVDSVRAMKLTNGMVLYFPNIHPADRSIDDSYMRNHQGLPRRACQCKDGVSCRRSHADTQRKSAPSPRPRTTVRANLLPGRQIFSHGSKTDGYAPGVCLWFSVSFLFSFFFDPSMAY